LGNSVFQPHVDGEIIGEAQRIGEPQAIFSCPIHRAGQHGQFAIGRGGKDIVARALGEVDGLAFLLDSAGLGGEKVHYPLPLGTASTKSATMPENAVLAMTKPLGRKDPKTICAAMSTPKAPNVR